mgnify:CR=1 FL=1
MEIKKEKITEMLNFWAIKYCLHHYTDLVSYPHLLFFLQYLFLFCFCTYLIVFCFHKNIDRLAETVSAWSDAAGTVTK